MVYLWTKNPGLVGQGIRALIPVPKGALCIEGACYGYYEKEYAEAELHPGKHYVLIRSAAWIAVVEVDVPASMNGSVLDIRSRAAYLTHLVLNNISGNLLYINGRLVAVMGNGSMQRSSG